MNEQPLTEKQAEVLAYVKHSIKTHGYGPTYRDISAHFEFSEKAAYDHIVAIHRKGYIQLQMKRPRSIKVMPNHLYRATQPIAELDIATGDYVHAIDETITAITKRIP